MSAQETQTVYRDCHLCEATCGIKVEVRNNTALSLQGDADDPASRGHICPKAFSILAFQNDPDRLRHPVRRVGDGWQEISWEEALEETASNLVALQERYGENAVGIYNGNPGAHDIGVFSYAPGFGKVLHTRNKFSASSVDQMPHQLVNLQMYGHQQMNPVPDLDRTKYLLVIGANPIASNGSMMGSPGIRGRLNALRDRGGRIVVIDPRRTETARIADEFHFIRPGTDAAFLAAVVCSLIDEDLIQPAHLAGKLKGLPEACDLLRPFTPERVASFCGIPAGDIRRLAREFAGADGAVCYGRMGMSTQKYASVCVWLVQLINVATGNLDREGGTMPSNPAIDPLGGPGSRPGHFAIWHSRVSGHPECSGELPVAAMAEEMLTPGDGQIRGFATIAGNPVLSVPDGGNLEKAFAGLDFMVSFDPYINETTRFAHIIIPPTTSLERFHYDILLFTNLIYNKAKASPAALEPPEGAMHEWEVFSQLTRLVLQKKGKKDRPPLPPELLVDMGLKTGPYGGDTGPLKDGLESLQANPSGFDLGPLRPSLVGRLPGGTIDCAPQLITADLPRLEADLQSGPGEEGALLLIGRRHLLSNNSWMHNDPGLMKGPDRCTLMMHPADARRAGLEDGGPVLVRSRIGSVRTILALSEDIMEGVVSLPHGYGHGRPGTRLGVAARHAGASINDLIDAQAVDAVSRNAAVNGFPVRVESLKATAAQP